jgi:hypothetical protein
MSRNDSDRADGTGQAIYIPANAALGAVLADLPHRLRPYRDHAALLLHFVAVKRWLGDVDAGGFARLSANVLRRYVPARVLAPLWEHLAGAGVVERAGHSAGRMAAGYRVRPAFDGPARRVVLTDQPLAARLAEWRSSYRRAGAGDGDGLAAVVERRQAVLDHVRGDLDALGLDAPVDAVVADAVGQGVDLGHAGYVAQAIANADHDGLLVDGFGWRVHSLVTRTAAAVRARLTLGGAGLVELDVRNAQPLLLAVAMLNPDLAHTMCSLRTSYWGDRRPLPCPVPPLPSLPSPLLSPDLASFSLACADGVLYERIMEAGKIAKRNLAKRQLFRDVLFGRPQVCSDVTRAFSRLWPGVLGWVQAVKRTCGYKAAALLLQRLESTIIIDGVCRRLLGECPGVRFLAVHDAAMVVSDAAEQVRGIMRDEFRRRGVGATVHVKGGR